MYAMSKLSHDPHQKVAGICWNLDKWKITKNDDDYIKEIFFCDQLTLRCNAFKVKKCQKTLNFPKSKKTKFRYDAHQKVVRIPKKFRWWKFIENDDDYIKEVFFSDQLILCYTAFKVKICQKTLNFSKSKKTKFRYDAHQKVVGIQKKNSVVKVHWKWWWLHKGSFSATQFLACYINVKIFSAINVKMFNVRNVKTQSWSSSKSCRNLLKFGSVKGH